MPFVKLKGIWSKLKVLDLVQSGRRTAQGLRRIYNENVNFNMRYGLYLVLLIHRHTHPWPQAYYPVNTI